MATSRRDYSMPDADLCMLASNLVVYMTRDQAQFTERGVTAAMVTTFQSLINAFEIFPPDEYYQASVTGEVELKNDARKSATESIQLISGFFEQKWGITGYQYKQLGIKNITNFTDSLFLVTCFNVANVATEYLSVLTSIGLSEADITALESYTATFESKLSSITTKKALRDSKTQERIDKGNELYSFCTNYSKVGKLIWENVDEAKYEDYVIYKTIHSGLSKPQNLKLVYVIGPPKILEITWDSVFGATNYDIFGSVVELGASSGEYHLLDNSLTTSYSASATSNKRNYFKVKAKNDTQTSDYSDEVYYDVPE